MIRVHAEAASNIKNAASGPSPDKSLSEIRGFLERTAGLSAESENFIEYIQLLVELYDFKENHLQTTEFFVLIIG